MGRLGSGPRLVGRIGSGVRVSVSFRQGGGWLPSPAYNVEPVTNTSSSSCENNERRTPPWVIGSTPSVAALFFTLRDSYGLQHCRPVCTRFLPTPPAFDAPVRVVLVGISPSRLARKKQNGFATRRHGTSAYKMPMAKKFRRYLYSFWRNSRTWQKDGQTDGHRMTAIAALMHSIARQK